MLNNILILILITLIGKMNTYNTLYSKDIEVANISVSSREVSLLLEMAFTFDLLCILLCLSQHILKPN